MHEMSVEERFEFAKKIFETEIKKLLIGKGKDYGGTKTANRNFTVAAEEIGLTKYQIWYVYFRKHLMAVQGWLANGKLESEPILSRIDDLTTYLFILRSMLEEDARGADQLPPNGKHFPALEATEVRFTT